MFVIPISHEEQTVQRLPWVTIGLIAANVLLFLVTLPIVKRDQREVGDRFDEVVRYAREHPYLRLPEGFPDVVRPDEPPADLPADVLAFQQARLEGLVQDLRTASSDSLFARFGSVPVHPRAWTFVTSLFLHGGWLHLLSNMMFLWLVGPSLEDRWGRVLFAALYLASGIVGDLTHIVIHARSQAPTIGASGAIAGLMGAFLIRLGRTRIRFVYWLFFRPLYLGRFSARAYVVLPFWALRELAGGLRGEEGGVAVWAHLGGFALGAGVAFVIRMSDLEARVLAPALEKKGSWAPSERLTGALGKLDRGDAEGAARDLEEVLRARPDDVDARMALVAAHAGTGDRAAAGSESARIVAHHLKLRNMPAALAAFREHALAYPDVAVPLHDQLALAAHYELLQEYQEAGELYHGAIEAWPDDPLAPSALLAYGRLTLRVFRRAETAAELLKRALEHPRAGSEVQQAAADLLEAARKEVRPRWRGAESAAPAGTGASGGALLREPAAAPGDTQGERVPAPPVPASAAGGRAASVSAPPPSAPTPPVAPAGRRLVPVSMRAVGIDARGLHLQDRRGTSGLLAWQRVVGISVGRIAGAEATDPAAGDLVLDLLMAPRATPEGAEHRCIRLSLEALAIPQLLSEPSPVRAFQRLTATVLKASSAPAYPSREACVRLEGLPAAATLAAYEADLLARLGGGG